MAGVLSLDVSKTMPPEQGAKTIVAVVPLVSDAPVMPPVDRPDERRHLPIRVRDGHPETRPWTEDARQLSGRDVVVVEVLEDRDRACTAETLVWEGQRLCCAHDELRPVVDAFSPSET